MHVNSETCLLRLIIIAINLLITRFEQNKHNEFKNDFKIPIIHYNFSQNSSGSKNFNLSCEINIHNQFPNNYTIQWYKYGIPLSTEDFLFHNSDFSLVTVNDVGHYKCSYKGNHDQIDSYISDQIEITLPSICIQYKISKSFCSNWIKSNDFVFEKSVDNVHKIERNFSTLYNLLDTSKLISVSCFKYLAPVLCYHNLPVCDVTILNEKKPLPICHLDCIQLMYDCRDDIKIAFQSYSEIFNYLPNCDLLITKSQGPKSKCIKIINSVQHSNPSSNQIINNNNNNNNINNNNYNENTNNLNNDHVNTFDSTSPIVITFIIMICVGIALICLVIFQKYFLKRMRSNKMVSMPKLTDEVIRKQQFEQNEGFIAKYSKFIKSSTQSNEDRSNYETPKLNEYENQLVNNKKAMSSAFKYFNKRNETKCYSFLKSYSTKDINIDSYYRNYQMNGVFYANMLVDNQLLICCPVKYFTNIFVEHKLKFLAQYVGKMTDFLEDINENIVESMFLFEAYDWNYSLRKFIIENEMTVSSFYKRLSLVIELAEYHSILEELKIVHGDISSRNYLLYKSKYDDKETVKIHYISRLFTIFNSDYWEWWDDTNSCPSDNGIFRQAIPIRWLSPEVSNVILTNNVSQITTKTLSGIPGTLESDVWSFGIFLWEIFTISMDSPFEKLTNYQVHNLQHKYLFEFLDLRLMNPMIGQIIIDCLSIDLKNRPTFSDILKSLKRITIYS